MDLIWIIYSHTIRNSLNSCSIYSYRLSIWKVIESEGCEGNEWKLSMWRRRLQRKKGPTLRTYKIKWKERRSRDSVLIFFNNKQEKKNYYGNSLCGMVYEYGRFYYHQKHILSIEWKKEYEHRTEKISLENSWIFYYPSHITFTVKSNKMQKKNIIIRISVNMCVCLRVEGLFVIRVDWYGVLQWTFFCYRNSKQFVGRCWIDRKNIQRFKTVRFI